MNEAEMKIEKCFTEMQGWKRPLFCKVQPEIIDYH